MRTSPTAGLIELASGVEIPCYESPERVLAIEAALLEDGGFAFEAPTEHGRGADPGGP